MGLKDELGRSLHLLGMLLGVTLFWQPSLGLAKDPTSIDVLDLRPTQFTISQYEVELKQSELLAEAAEGKKKYIKAIEKEPAQVVLGPDGVYLIDGHHLALAIDRIREAEGVPTKMRGKIAVDILHDWSDLSRLEFTERLKNERYFFLWDENGRRREVRDLPRSIRSLKNDPYRVMAGITSRQLKLKGLGSYARHYLALELRRAIPPEELAARPEESYRKAIPIAREWAKNWEGPEKVEGLSSRCLRVF